MRWFKAIEPTDTVMLPIFDKYGWEGYGLAIAFLGEAYSQNLTQVNQVHLKKWLGITTPKAAKLLPDFNHLLSEVTHLFGKVDQVLPKVDQSLVKIEASNPDGSIKEEREIEKIDKKEESNIPPLPPQGEESNFIDPVFEEIWLLYPKKKSKGQAKTTWVKLKPNEQLVEQMKSAISKAKTSADWLKNGGEFIPHLSTWLNAQGWLDEYTQALMPFSRLHGNKITPNSERQEYSGKL